MKYDFKQTKNLRNWTLQGSHLYMHKISKTKQPLPKLLIFFVFLLYPIKKWEEIDIFFCIMHLEKKSQNVDKKVKILRSQKIMSWKKAKYNV